MPLYIPLIIKTLLFIIKADVIFELESDIMNAMQWMAFQYVTILLKYKLLTNLQNNWILDFLLTKYLLPLLELKEIKKVVQSKHHQPIMHFL